MLAPWARVPLEAAASLSAAALGSVARRIMTLLLLEPRLRAVLTQLDR